MNKRIWALDNFAINEVVLDKQQKFWPKFKAYKQRDIPEEVCIYQILKQFLKNQKIYDSKPTSHPRSDPA